MIPISTTPSGIGAITVTTLRTIIHTPIHIPIIMIGTIPVPGLIITTAIIAIHIIMVRMPAGKDRLRADSKSTLIASPSNHHHPAIKSAGLQSAPIGSFKMPSICP